MTMTTTATRSMRKSCLASRQATSCSIYSVWFDNLHVRRLQPLTEEQIAARRARTGLLFHWIVYYGYIAGLDMTKFRPLHDCSQSLFTSYIVMNWAPEEDIKKHGIGIFADQNHSFSSLIARAAGLNQDGIGIYDISPFAFPRSKSGKYPFTNLIALVRDFMDAFFYVESKESVKLGNRTILHMGKEVRESFTRGVASARLPIYREALIQLFGQDLVDLPDIILTDGSISCVAGPGFKNLYPGRFQLAHLPGQDPAMSSITIRADSLAHHQHSSLQESLQQGSAFELFLALSNANSDDGNFRRRTMHENKIQRNGEYLIRQTSSASARARSFQQRKSFSQYFSEDPVLALWMKSNIMLAKNKEHLKFVLSRHPYCTSEATETHPLRLIIHRFLLEDYTFDDITSHLQGANLAVPELLTTIWDRKSKATTAARKAGELSEERLAELSKQNAAKQERRLANVQQKLVCYNCTINEARGQWYQCGGTNRNQTICGNCYEKERQANISGPCYDCGAEESRQWLHCGGEERDQTICESCYGKERHANISGPCYNCGAKETPHWYQCGGTNRDQTICNSCYRKQQYANTNGPCYDCGAKKTVAWHQCGGEHRDQTICNSCYEKQRQANISGPCYDCGAKETVAWHQCGGPNRDQTICNSCYLNQRRANICGPCEDDECGAAESVKWHRRRVDGRLKTLCDECSQKGGPCRTSGCGSTKSVKWRKGGRQCHKCYSRENNRRKA